MDDAQGFEKLKELNLLKYFFKQFVLRQSFSHYLENKTCEKALSKLEAAR